MRAALIIIHLPGLDLAPCIGDGFEPVQVQALVAQREAAVVSWPESKNLQVSMSSGPRNHLDVRPRRTSGGVCRFTRYVNSVTIRRCKGRPEVPRTMTQGVRAGMPLSSDPVVAIHRPWNLCP